MYIVQHVEMKSVFTFQPIKWLVSNTVWSAKPAATFWMFVLRTKNRQLGWVARMVHIVLQEKRVATTEKKSLLHFWKSFSLIISKDIRTWTRKSRSYSIYGMIVSTPHWLIQLTKSWFTLSFYTLSVYIKATWFSQSPTTVLRGFSFGPG